MSDPALGLLMLTLIVVVIMMGFPTAFTLMGLGIVFGFIAFYVPGEPWLQNKVFDLMVERTYGAMTNDVLISIPLFVLMGYVMERGALVDKMFYSIQLAFRRVPASLAVATLIVCTFWGIASGLVGAVVVLNTAIGVVQEVRAERAIAALDRLAAPRARVVRDDRVRHVAAAELVPGDLVRMDAGDVVPADLHLQEAVTVEVDEAAMTGESLDGFSTTVFPVTIAADVIPAMIAIGKFHGGITAPTPSGMYSSALSSPAILVSGWSSASRSASRP